MAKFVVIADTISEREKCQKLNVIVILIIHTLVMFNVWNIGVDIGARRITMIYKCDNCGRVFTDEQADTRKELVSEFWGAPAYKEYYCCPDCRSDEIEEYHESEEGGAE